jgi:PAS domain S-box-containing protein
MLLNKQGVILRTNRSFQDFYGLNYEQLTGANFTSLFESYSLSEFLKIHELTLQKPYIQQENSITTGYGETRWVQLHFTHLDQEMKDTLLLTITDLTPLRSQAEKISREYEQIKLLADAVFDAILVVNSMGFIEWQNHTAQNLFGYKDHQLVGQSYSRLMPSLKKVVSEIDPIHHNGESQNGKNIHGVDTKIISKTGKEIQVRIWMRRKRLRHRTIQILIIRDLSAKAENGPDLAQIREQFLKEIGQDLHDSIGGMLSGITLIGEQLIRQTKGNNHAMSQKLEEVVDLIRQTDQLTHLLARGMMREGQLLQGFIPSLERLSQRVSKLFHVHCALCVPDEANLLTDEVVVQLYSIVEEAVGNAIRHGRADQICVSIGFCKDSLTLEIEDNGVGFSKIENGHNPSESSFGGLGLQIMNKRALKLGGELTIDRTRDRKTVVRCVIPLNKLHLSQRRNLPTSEMAVAK